MLRHFKMELKRQQLEQIACQENMMMMSMSNSSSLSAAATAAASSPVTTIHEQRTNHIVAVNQATNLSCAGQSRAHQPHQQLQQRQPGGQVRVAENAKPAERPAAKRVRGRRSSKPMMEKRRRARINECLDILKSYVLTDTNNLAHLGVDVAGDPTANENRDEETIARTILKSSGLINRHRGRKNPNKLEKADILELTVDYVRRLHEQRNQLLSSHQLNHSSLTLSSSSSMTNHQTVNNIPTDNTNNHYHHHNHHHQRLPELIPAHLNQPLTLDLSPKSRLSNQSTPPSPPPSSASSSPNGDLLGVNNNAAAANQQQQQSYMSKMILSRVLDANYAGLYEWKPTTSNY